jgi:hypothetical protein
VTTLWQRRSCDAGRESGREHRAMTEVTWKVDELDDAGTMAREAAQH